MTIKVLILELCTLLIYLIVVLYVFNSHYVAIGDCAVMEYYTPLEIWDKIAFIILGLIAFSCSYLIYSYTRCKIKHWILSLKLLIFVGSSIVFCTIGNEILGSRKVHWPEEYQVKPIHKPISLAKCDVYTSFTTF